jgi:hypothetical protein
LVNNMNKQYRDSSVKRQRASQANSWFRPLAPHLFAANFDYGLCIGIYVVQFGSWWLGQTVRERSIIFSQMTQVIAPEDFINFSCCESFRSQKTCWCK